MKRIRNRIQQWIPPHARKILILVFFYNMLVFYLPRILRVLLHNNTYYVFDTALDNKIPLLPFMIVIYFGCYAFWAVNYVLCSRYDEKQAKQFLYADLIGKTVCLFFYIFLPTTMERTDPIGNNLFTLLLRFLYRVDMPDNLFPSIHCFCSWLCYIGMRADKRYPKKYRIFSLVFAIAVCISTVTVKQHLLIDIPAGILLAEASFWLSKKLFK